MTFEPTNPTTGTTPPATENPTPDSHGPRRIEARSVEAEAAVVARAAAGGYAMVGPSARTWSVDPATGVPVGPVPQAEHRLVRDLIAQQRLDGAEPVWLPCADGGEEIVTAVIPARPAGDDPPDRGDAPDPERGQRGDHDSWFSGGYDAAHQAHLDRLGHVDTLAAEPATAASTAAADVPAGLDARLAALGARIADRGGEPFGGWRTVSARTAAEELAQRGTDLDTASGMVEDYLQQTAQRAGVPVEGWGLDQGDIDAIAAAHQLPAAAHAVVEQDAATDRLAEVRRWQTADWSTDQLFDHAADGPVQVDAELWGDGDDDGAGWSR